MIMLKYSYTEVSYTLNVACIIKEFTVTLTNDTKWNNFGNVKKLCQR